MKIGSIGIYKGDIVRILQLGQSVAIVELLDNPRMSPFTIKPSDLAVFWI